MSFIKANWESIRYQIALFSIILFASSLPSSFFGISLSLFLLLGIFVLDIIVSSIFVKATISDKINHIWKDKAVAIILLFYALHLIGYFYSEDKVYAFKEIRILIPLALLTLVLGSKSFKIKAHHLKLVLYFFVASVFVSSMICYYHYLFSPYTDIRNISVLISHIRFGTMLAIAELILLYLIFFNTYNWNIRIVFILLFVWFAYYMIISESMSGIMQFLVTMLLFSIIILAKLKSLFIKVLSLLVILSLISIGTITIIRIYHNVTHAKPIDLDKLATHTKLGNKYIHQKNLKDTENGYLVWINISHQELENAWRKRSSISYNGEDRQGHILRYTLIRYLASKGLTKDAEGLSKLNEQDIKAVEDGIPNYIYLKKSGFYRRLHISVWELHHYINNKRFEGASLAMRLKYWEIGIQIIKKNPIFGHGTGDIRPEYEKIYKNLNISKQWQRFSHNQFIYITITLGLTGLLLFLTSLVFPLYYFKKQNDFLYITIFSVLVLSFFTEDTLTSQAGVSLFAFFNSLLLFNRFEE